MINCTTGEAVLGGISFSTQLTRKSFENSRDFLNAKVLSSNDSWISYVINFAQGYVVAKFRGEKLSSLMIGFNLPDENLQGGWESWSQENERKRKQLHDQILREELGAISRSFSWGEVGSVVDPKTCDSSIFVQYV